MTLSPTILVCDDETDLREMLQEYLQKRGYSVILAADAAEMRQQVDAGAPDLILLDINMPGEDGLSALRNLRTENDVPVVMLTAAGETIDKIVGHAPATVRERHYAPATDEQTRAAIELIPPMDWGPGIATVQWGYGVPTVSPRDNVVRLRGA